MIDYKVICKYCNHTWVEKLFYPESIKYCRCPGCKDTNVELATKDAFGYNEKKKETKINNNPFGY